MLNQNYPIHSITLHAYPNKKRNGTHLHHSFLSRQIRFLREFYSRIFRSIYQWQRRLIRDIDRLNKFVR